MGEVIDAAIHVLHNPTATPDDLMTFVKGPDFPTGALILGRQGILDAYRTGRGSIKMRAVAEIEEGRVGDRIVVTEFPYQTSVEVIEQKISDLVRAGELDGISGVLNSSANQKPRLVIELKRDANANVVLNNLYKQTPLQTSFRVSTSSPWWTRCHAPQPGPGALSLHRPSDRGRNRRRAQFRLRKAQERAHIVEGLLRAIDMLDAVIATIRGSDDRPSARTSLMAEPFSFSEIQATHILDMALGRLTRLGHTELQEEMAKLLETIAELESILADDGKLRGVIDEEMTAIRDESADPRRSIVTHDPGEMGVEDLIDDEEIVVTMTKGGYIKSVAAAAFRTQGRGGRGVQGARLKEEDLVSQVVHSSAHAYLLLFSNQGKVYRLRGHEIPMKERTAKGRLRSISSRSRRTSRFRPSSHAGVLADKYLVFATAQGQVKKTALSEYDKSRREGFIAINLRDGDELVRVVATSGDDDIFEVTRSGMTIRFNESDVRAMGRDAAGVRGIRLRAGDAVVSCDVAADDTDILIVTDAGYGKRTKLERFNSQARGGQGVRGIRLTGKRGSVVAAFMVALDEEILLVSSGGVVIRTAARDRLSGA